MKRRSTRPASTPKRRWFELRRSRLAISSAAAVGVLTAGASTAAALGAFREPGPLRSSPAANRPTAIATRSGTVSTLSTLSSVAAQGGATASSTQSTALATRTGTQARVTTMSTTSSTSAVSATPQPGAVPTSTHTSGGQPILTQTLSVGGPAGQPAPTETTTSAPPTTEVPTTAPPRDTTTTGATPTTTGTTSATTTTTRTQTGSATSTHASPTTQTATSTGSATPPVPISLSSGAARTYAPGQTVQTAVADPADAIDGSQRTAWSWTLGPSDAGAVDAGLLLDLRRAISLRSVTIVTATPWMSIVVKGATGPVPKTITAPGWIQLARVKALDPMATVALRHTGTPVRHLLIWITHPPPGVNSGRLQLNDVTVMPESGETGAGH